VEFCKRQEGNAGSAESIPLARCNRSAITCCK
jgi:hypothetical protein